MKLKYCKFCGKPLQSHERDICTECNRNYCMTECKDVQTGAAQSWHKGICVKCEHNPYRRLYRFRFGKWQREPRYEVVEDLQGSDFGMYRRYTVKQWRMQALEWCFADDDDWEAARIMRTSDNELIDYISQYWQLKFEKLDGDIQLSDGDVNNYSDETPEEYYNKWFDPQPEGDEFWRI